MKFLVLVAALIAGPALAHAECFNQMDITGVSAVSATGITLSTSAGTFVVQTEACPALAADAVFHFGTTPLGNSNVCANDTVVVTDENTDAEIASCLILDIVQK